MMYPNYLAAIQIIRSEKRPLQRLSSLLTEEKFPEAAALVRAKLSEGGTPEDIGAWWQLLGDIQVLIGDFAAAEAVYEKALVVMDGHPLVGAMSCRTTGILAIVRGRLEISSRCFVRNLQSPDSDTRLEALAVCALLFREGGMLDEAASLIERLKDASVSIRHDSWLYLAQTLARDIDVYRELLNSPRLRDHVYWQVAEPMRPASSTLAPSVPGPNVLPAVRVVLMRRQQQLSELLAVQRGECPDRHLDSSATKAPHPWPSSAAWLSRMSLQELALAALASGQPAAAARLLARVPGNLPSLAEPMPIAGVVRPAQIEFAYCMAKSMMERGLATEGLALYRRYLKVAMETIRSLSATLNLLHANVPRAAAAATKDAENDPAVQLPHRYRRAYEYLRQHYARNDLSVHEIAASIGVSERALQMRFKNVFGASPRELIRQLRACD